jgi:hypothetical protein
LRPETRIGSGADLGGGDAHGGVLALERAKRRAGIVLAMRLFRLKMPDARFSGPNT